MSFSRDKIGLISRLNELSRYEWIKDRLPPKQREMCDTVNTQWRNRELTEKAMGLLGATVRNMEEIARRGR